jgi:lipopolysaccharide cholinephosphotransferase
LGDDHFMLEADSESLAQVHALQLSMLVEVDRVCRAYDMEYFLIFGTLLGAVRHGGFIPWDDDIDIGVFREDYDNLLALLETELDQRRYVVQTAENDAGAAFPYAKIRCLRTLFEEAVTAPDAQQNQGVFIDIFPLDNAPDDEKEAKRLKSRFIRHNLAYRYKVEGYRSDRLFVNAALAVRALRDIPTLLTKRREIMTSCEDASSRLLIAFPAAVADYDSSFLERDQMRPARQIDFCGYKVMAPAQTDVQLRALFGDYMSLPPKSARVGHRLRAFSIDEDHWSAELARYLPAVGRDRFKESEGGTIYDESTAHG